jgi:hypothetical protein
MLGDMAVPETSREEIRRVFNKLLRNLSSGTPPDGTSW